MKRSLIFVMVVLTIVGIIKIWPSLPTSSNGNEQFSYELDTLSFEQALETSVEIGDTVDLSKIKVIKTNRETFEKEEIPVTPDMVEGDYSAATAGVKNITISYDGQKMSYSFAIKYTVNFVAYGIVVDTQKVLLADEIKFPDGRLYTKYGMSFIGWSPAPGDEIEDNAIFTARYISNTVSDVGASYGQTLADVNLPSDEYGKWVFSDNPDTLVGGIGVNSFGVKYVSNLYGAEEVKSTVNLNVSKGRVEFSNIVTDFVYDGEAKFPTYNLGVDVPVSEMGERGIEVGTYDFTLLVSNEFYEGVYIGTYTISKAQATVTLPDYEYDFDEVKTFIPTQYTVSGVNPELLGSLTLTKPTIAGHGNYKIGVEIENSKNVSLTVVGGNIDVRRADLELADPTLADGVVATYGDKLSALPLTEHGSGVWSWKNPELTVNTAASFTGTVVFTPNNPDGYNSVERTITLSVNKKELVISVTKTDFIYNGRNQAVEYTVGDGSFGDVATTVTYDGGISAKNAGKYSVSIEIVDDRYRGSATVQMTIAKAVPVTDFGRKYEISWSPSGRTLGNVTLASGYSWLESTKAIPESNIGKYVSYPAVYIPEDTGNYETVYGEISLMMNKADANITVLPSYKFEYNGDVHAIDGITASHSEAALKYADSNGAPFDINGIKNVGVYNITVSLEETEHYKAASKSFTVTVTGGKYPGITAPEGLVATFGDTLADVELPMRDDGVWSWNMPLDTKVGNAGSRSFIATFAPNDTGYDKISVNVNISVSKKELTLSVINDSFTYDGTAKRVEISIVGYADASHSVSLDGNTSAINTGSYPLTISVVDDNYYGSVNATLVISKAVYTPSPVGTLGAVYGNTLSDVALPTDDNGVWIWDNPLTTSVGNAGERTFNATFVHEDSENYENYSAQIRITVAKKSVDVPTVNSKVFTGATLRADLAASQFYTVKANSGGVGAGSYPVVLELNNPANYVWADGTDTARIELDFIIKKASASLSGLTLNGWTYGDGANAPSYTVTDVYDGQVNLLYTGTTRSGVLYSSSAVPTEAGSYKLTISIAPTDNCDITVGSAEREFTVAARKVNIPSVASKAYTGAHQSADINTVGMPYSVTLNAGGENVTADGYAVTLTLDSASYVWYDGVSTYDGLDCQLKFYITKATNGWQTPVSVPGIVYDSGEVQYSAAPKFGADGMTVEYKPYGGLDSAYTTVKPTNVGSYTARFTVGATDNYTGLVAECNFAISIADNEWITEPTISKLTWTYGEASAVLNVGEAEFGDVEVTVNGAPYVSMPTDAGVYVIRIYAPATENYKGLEKTVTVTVKKKTVTAPSAQTTVYNGTEQSSSFADTDGVWSAENITKTNVGNYAVKLTLSDPDNYEWVGNESSESVNVTFSITRAENEWTSIPSLDKTAWKYDDAAALIGAYGARFGDVKITLGANELTDGVIPDGLTVGEYTLTFAVAETSNYTGLEKQITFNISKAQVEIPEIAASAVYNGSAQSAQLVSLFGLRSGAIYTIKTNVSEVNRGLYDIVLELVDPVNYTWVILDSEGNVAEELAESTAASKFEITQATNSWSDGNEPSVDSITFGEELTSTAVSEFGANVVIMYKPAGADDSEYTEEMPSAAGDYVAKFTVATDANENYSALEETVEFSIAKKEISVPSDISVVYNKKNQTSGFAGEFSAANVTAMNVGTYDVTLTLYNTDNYVWVNSDGKLDGDTVTVKFSITKATVSVKDLDIDGWTYGDSASSPTYTVSNEYDGRVSFLYTGLTESGMAYSSSEIPSVAGAYKLTVSIAPTDNCDVSVASDEAEFTVERRTVIAPTSTPEELYYDGENHIPTIEGLDENCVMGENLGITNVGDYYVDFNLPDIYNYEWSSGGTDEISLKYYTVKRATNAWTTAPSLNKYTWKYDEAQAIISAAAKLGQLKITLNGEVITEIPDSLDVGKYTLSFTVEGNDNYTGLDETIDFEITPAVVSVTVVPNSFASKTYNSSNQIADGAVSGVGYTVINNGGVNVGTYDVIYKLVSSNYIWSDTTTADKTVDFTIVPAVVTVPGINPKQYIGSTLTADIVKNDLLYSVILNDGGIDVGTYPVKIKLADSHNYVWSGGDSDKDGVAELDFVITQAAMNGWQEGYEPKLDKTEWTYGDASGVASATPIFGEAVIEYKPYNAGDDQYTSDMPTAAGKYTARFLVNGNDDYVSIAPTTVDFTIKKKSVTVSVTQNEFIYDGQAHSLIYEISGLVGSDTVTVLGNNAHTAAGDYAITLSINETNYECTPVSATLKIAKAPSNPTVPAGITATYGDTLSDVELPSDVDGAWAFTDTSLSVGAVGTHSFEAVFTPSDDNYATYKTELSVSVGRKTLTLSVTDNTFDYDGKTHSVEYSIIGLVGEDTVTVSGNLSKTEAGRYAVTLAVDDERYVASVETQLVINAVEYPNKTTPDTVEAIYGDTLSDLALPTDENGLWEWISPSDSVGGVGTRSFAAKFTPTSTNYKPYTVNVGVAVEKKTLTITVTDKEFTYSGDEYSLIYEISGLVGNDTVTVLGNTVQTEHGSYAVTLSINEANYKCDPVSATLIINKADYIPTLPTGLGATYGDTLADVELPTVEGGEWTWVESTESVGAVGEKTFVAVFTPTSSNYNVYTVPLTVSVVKKTVEIPATDTSSVYNGGEQSTDYENGDNYTVTNAVGTNVGDYTVSFKLDDADSYVWVDENGEEIDGDTVTVKFSITKATVSVTDVAIGGWTFGNAASALSYSVGVYDGNVSVLYTGMQNDGTPYSSTSAPTAAGSYKVTVSIAPTDNCDVSVASGEKTFEIARKTVTEPTSTPEELYYDGENHIPTIEGLDENCVMGENLGITNVGDYYVDFNLPDIYNYEWSSGGTDEISLKYYTVKRATNEWTTAPSLNKYTWKYDEAQAIISAAAKLGQLKITLNGEVITEIPDSLDVGKYTLSFTVEGNDNYTGLDETIDFEITPAVVSVTVVPNSFASKTYNGSNQIADGAVSGVGYTVVNNGGVNVGTYDVIYKLVSSNYIWSDTTTADKTVDFTINPKPIDIPTAQYSKPYNGKLQTSGATADEGYTVSETGGVNAGRYSVTYKLVSGNYVWSDATTADKTVECFTITKLQVTAPSVITTVPYNGETQSATSDSSLYTASGSGMNVGEYTVTLTLTDSTNYEWDGANTSKLVIEEATPVIAGLTIDGWTYGSYVGNMPTASVSNISGVDIVFKLNGSAVTSAMLEALEPGTYTIVAEVAKTDNYEAATKSVTFTVDKITVTTPTITGSYTYNGNPITVSVPTSANYTIIKNSGYVTAGTHEVVLALKDSVHYKWSTDSSGTSETVSIPFEIKKAQVTISSVGITNWTYGSYNAETNKPSANGMFYDGTLSFSYSGTTFGGVAYGPSATPPTAAGNYTVTATVSGTDNCVGASKSTSFTVAKQKLDVPTVDSKDYTGEKLYPDVNTTLFTVDGATNAGAHNLSITIRDTANYEWRENPTEAKTVSFTINKATTTLSIAVTDTVYTGAQYAGITTTTNLKAYDITYYYSSDGGTTWITTAPTNAGVYKVYAKIEETANYTGAQTDTFEFTISKATPDVSFVDYNGAVKYQNDVTHIGTALGVDGNALAGTFESTKALSFTSSSIRNNQVISYTVTYRPTDATNYNSVTSDGLIVVLKPAAYIGSSPASAMWYGSIEDALDNSKSGDTVWTVMDVNDVYSGGNTIVRNCTVPTGVTLVLPYAEGVKNANDAATLNGIHNYVDGPHGYQLYLLQDLDGDEAVDDPTDTYLRITNTVTVAPGVIITNAGKIEIAGELSGGNGGSPYSGHTAGAAAQLILSTNAQIVSTGTIKTYGFIEESYKNNGSKVTINSGDIYMPFVLRDHRGGTRIAGVVLGGGGIASPFNRMTFNNVMPTLEVGYYGNIRGIANMYADGVNHNTIGHIIGNANTAIIQLTNSTSGKIIAKYDKDTEVCKLDIYGGATTNGMTISAAGNEVNTKDFAFAISYQYDINLKLADGQTSATYTMGQLFKLMPGAKLVVESGVTLNVTNMNILGKDFVDPCDTLKYPNNGTYSINPATGEILEGGQLIIYGTLNATSIGGNVYIMPGGTTNDLSGKSSSTKELITASLLGVRNSFNTYSQNANVINVGTGAFDVTLDSNGGNELGNIIVTDSAYPKLPTPTRYGCIFLGWYNGETLVKEGDPVTASHTLTARWKDNTYVLSFDTDGGFDEKDIIAEGGVYPTLPVPAKPGFEFLGWFYNGEEVKAGDEITESHTLRAKWQNKKIGIIFDSAGGNTFDTVYIEAGSANVYPSLPTPTRKGYTFLGWFYGVEQIANGSALKINATHVITASWQKDSVVVSFNSDGGSAVDDVLIAPTAEQVYPTLPTPTRVGYTFDGWYFGDEKVVAGDALHSDEPHVLTAKWTRKTGTITVTLDHKDKSWGTTTKTTITIDLSQTLEYPELLTPKRTLYKFLGWYYNGVRVTAGMELILDSNHTLTAQWEFII